MRVRERLHPTFIFLIVATMLLFSTIWTINPMSLAQSQDYPPIRTAILERDVGKVRRLVAAGADMEQPLFNDESPALMAAKVDCWDIVLFLLEQGADPAAPDVFGDTIAPIARTSRLHPDAPEYADLEAVRAILRERGLY